MTTARSVLHWPIELLGINWLGVNEFAPPNRFLIGRPSGGAWINGVRPDYDDEVAEVEIQVCWDATRIDPLSCTLVTRVEREGAPFLVQTIRISDLPARGERSLDAGSARQPYQMGWAERSLTCRLPRGPSGTEWGVSLMSPDGLLLDEMPVARRVEGVKIRFDFGAAQKHVAQVGSVDPRPTGHQINEAVTAAEEVLRAARDAAAARRVSTLGDLESYLRWRFACRAGELLVLDPYLLDGDTGTVARTIAFLRSLDRPIRALCGTVPSVLPPGLEARQLPKGRRSLHDRVWIVGETGLLVGGSVSTFMSGRDRATTVTELPYADSQQWRKQFGEWW